MMLRWLPYPMVRIALFFMGGVVYGIYFPEFFPFKVIVALGLLLTAAFFVVKASSKNNKFPLASGLIGLIVIFLLGYARLVLFTHSTYDDHFSKIKSKIEAYEAIVRSVPEEKAKSWKVEIELKSVKGNLTTSKLRETGWQPVTGKLLLYVSKGHLPANNWEYGDHILVKGSPQELSPPANPGEFDFKRFLSFKNISHQQFVQPEDVKFIGHSSRKGFIYYSNQTRAWSMTKLNEFIHGDDEKAIAIALVLGVADGIDNDLQNAYAASGAMHVLAVSGMHVGIIYAIILLLVKPLGRYWWSKWVTAAASLILLWCFAFVTGLSPSVLRAVTMFSFIALARPFGKRTNIYNTLAASVFVLLVYNPYLIMSVGFQLSYLAVIGIVFLQRPLYNLWEIENRLGDWVWQITGVSIAAQIATFALGLLYFHQFPTYFLISNLFVIPLSTVVLVMGIFLLATGFISPVASLTGAMLEWLVKLMNWIVFKTEALPMSLINDIHISLFQCWLLMGILVTLILLFEFKSIQWLYFSFFLVTMFTVEQWNHFFNFVDQKQLIVYSVNGHKALEYIDRGQSYFLADSALSTDQERIRFHIQPNRLQHGVSNTTARIPFLHQKNGVNYFSINKKTFAWISNEKATFPLNNSIDYLIVSHNALRKTGLVKARTSHIIFDGTNSNRILNSLRQENKNNKIELYSVLDKGAFILQ